MIAAEELNVAGQARRRWLRRYGLASLGAAVILVWAGITLVLAVAGWMTGSRLSSKFPPLEEDTADAASDLPGTQNGSAQS